MRLEVFREGLSLGGYTLEGSGECRLGRGRQNQVILPHPEVSRLHAVLLRRGDSVHLTDRSTNGTFLKGKPTRRAVLAPGDEFTVGPYLLRLTGEEPDWNRETEVKKPGKGAAGGAFQGMVGSDKAMGDLFALVEKVAASEGTVLIQGETGSGKELVARAVHALSPRSGGPFVPLNCGAISPELVESELFGHERGAFTGAVGSRRGAFEEAQRGTLFLDEVGELPLPLQPKLLRALETGAIRRVGGQGEVKVSVRIVAATHRNLKEAADRGAFREDLLHRLFVLPVRIPPLRDRPGDILLLAGHFLGGRVGLTAEARDRLLAYPWPGNVRELKNVLERACILKEGGPIAPGDLVFLDEAQLARERTPQTMEEVEKLYFTRALEASGGSIREAARSLGVPKSTFHDRMKKYGIKPPHRPGNPEE